MEILPEIGLEAFIISQKFAVNYFSPQYENFCISLPAVVPVKTRKFFVFCGCGKMFGYAVGRRIYRKSGCVHYILAKCCFDEKVHEIANFGLVLTFWLNVLGRLLCWYRLALTTLSELYFGKASFVTETNHFMLLGTSENNGGSFKNDPIKVIVSYFQFCMIL